MRTHAERAAYSRENGGGWVRYKNRKKTIRQQFNAGRIDAKQRVELLAEAKRTYLSGQLSEAARKWQQAFEEGRRWLEENEALNRNVMSSGCNEECVSARGFICLCPCGGENHGAVHGTVPSQVTAYMGSRKTRTAAKAA